MSEGVKFGLALAAFCIVIITVGVFFVSRDSQQVHVKELQCTAQGGIYVNGYAGRVDTCFNRNAVIKLNG